MDVDVDADAISAFSWARAIRTFDMSPYGERHGAVFHKGHVAASTVVRAGTPVVDGDRLGTAGDGVGRLVQNHFHSSQPVILFAEVRLHQAVIIVPVLVLVLVLVLLSWYNQLQLVHQW